MFKTDIDRLHSFYLDENLRRERRTGKTTANIFELLGCVQVSDDDTMFVVRSEGSFGYIIDMIRQIFDENEMDYKIYRIGRTVQILVNYDGIYKKIWIYSNLNIKEKLAGFKGNLIINDDVDKLHFY
jgi:hypothetical protein